MRKCIFTIITKQSTAIARQMSIGSTTKTLSEVRKICFLIDAVSTPVSFECRGVDKPQDLLFPHLCFGLEVQ